MMTDDLINLLASSAYFDLSDVADRARSNTSLVDLFFDLQSFIRPKTFLEIGAFDAGFSRRARVHHPCSKVIAFEANPHNHAHFQSQFDFPQNRIDYRHLAVSNNNGVTDFLVQKNRNGVDVPSVAGDNSLFSKSHTEGDINYNVVRVPTVTLDAEISDAHFSTDDFSLWVDVEGATKGVFEGATNIIPRIQSIFIEVEERPFWTGQWLFSDINSFLRGHGFRAVARDYENAHQFNVVFVHERVMRHFMFPDRLVTYTNRIARNV